VVSTGAMAKRAEQSRANTEARPIMEGDSHALIFDSTAHILDNVTLYWLTGTGVSAARRTGRASRPASTAEAGSHRR
jgi:hypothetical protein